MALNRYVFAGPTALDDLHAALDRFWSDHPHVPEEVRLDVAIAAGEVATNIIEHDHIIGFQMQIQLLPDAVLIEFTDHGDAAAVDLAAVRMPDEMAPRGRGLAIARGLLGRLDYVRDDAGNHWRLLSKPFSAE